MIADIIRDETNRIMDRLPADATYDDVIYELYIRQSIRAGIDDCNAGRVLSTDDTRRRLGLIR